MFRARVNDLPISSKLGLTDDIIEDAQNHVASDAKHFEDVLAELEKTRVELEKEHEIVSKSRKEISELKKSLKEKNEKIDNSKDRILQHAKRGSKPHPCRSQRLCRRDHKKIYKVGIKR